MTLSILFKLALSGTRADTLRVALTAVSAALATFTLLGGATTLSIHGDWSESGDHYTNALLREPGLRPGVALTLFLLTIPVLGLAAQSARIGAPGRDRRLAALRMAGATPGQAVLVAAAETGVAALIGTVGSVAVYFGGRRIADRPDPTTRDLPLPTDVLPPVWAFAVICVAVPLLAAGLAAVTLRRVTIGPLGVVHAVRRRAPRPWPGVLIVVGFAVFPTSTVLLNVRNLRIPVEALLISMVLGAATALCGLVLGTGWLSAWIGRVLHRFGRGPATLLAGARLAADPWTTARSFTALLLTLAFGAGVATVAANIRAEQDLNLRADALLAQYREADYPLAGADPFFDRAFQLIYYAVLAGVFVAAAALLVSVAESVVTRRRSYASLVATGVPRGVLARSALWQTMAPLLVAVPATLALGVGMPLALFGRPSQPGGDRYVCKPPPGTVGDCGDPEIAERFHSTVRLPTLDAEWPIPWREVILLAGGALLVALLVTALGLLVLRPSTRAAELRTT